jgi:membrane peptidoglycan carboxypeptidase
MKNIFKPLLQKKIVIILLCACGLCALSVYPMYLVGSITFKNYFDRWSDKLIALEKKGLLSNKLGAAWQDVLKDEAMEQEAGRLIKKDTSATKTGSTFVDGVAVKDYPSLTIIARLNAIQNYANQILINDCNDQPIARIRTNHTRAKINEFPPVLLKSLVAAEDQNFWNNTTGLEYGSIVRAVGAGIIHSITHFKPFAPRGTSTITQQVAKLFISDVDESGQRHVSKTIDRKLREMRLAAALRKMYSPGEILEVYVNHCLTSDNGLIGCKDIARALFNKELSELSDAQCVYIARMVKWGRNTKDKIARQCAADMPRMGKANGWNKARQARTLSEIRRLTFSKPSRILTDFGSLVDCANEFWLAILKNNGATRAQCDQMNILDPNSLIRTKGDLTIKLTIDLPLQRLLERCVNARGYAPDTMALVKGKPVLVPGQYFAYCIMDSKTGKLLAYYSKDKIGSRLSGLLRYRTPNGSSTAKPIFNALMFDLGIFKPYTKWNDSVEVTSDVPWKRTFHVEKGKVTGVIFSNSAVKGKGYEVHNHLNVFEGCQYVFDQLSASNNILAVETVYRLNQRLFESDGGVCKDAFGLAQYFYRIGALDKIKNDLRYTSVTGVRAYKELAEIVGVNVDSLEPGKGRGAVSDSLYSVALGTLELSLYEQMHLFNVLYDNELIERPAEHPSLAVENILLNGDTVRMSDVITRYHPFASVNNLRPTYLGLHKRLVSGAADGLDAYDVCAGVDSGASSLSTSFSDEVLTLEGPVSNFAKSGTTDDVIYSYNSDGRGVNKTNFGVWNAVVRTDLSKLSNENRAPDVRDITVACIGECNERRTGPRDGKTLHKFITNALLKTAGVPCPNGFFKRYEAYIKRVTPDDIKNCSDSVSLGRSGKSEGNIFTSILSIFKKK